MRIGGKFPFIHRGKNLSQEVKELSQELAQVRANINSPSATLEDFFKEFGWDTSSNAGITVDKESAMTHSAVWRAMNILSSSIAGLPVGVYRKDPGGNITQIPNHPGARLLKSPNNFQTGFIFREAIQYNVLGWGNGFALIDRDGNYKPLKLYIQDPGNINVELAGELLLYEIKNQFRKIDGDMMLHVPALSWDGILGKSPIQVARESIGGGLAVQQYGNKFFANGAKQTGVLIHPGVLGDKGKMNLRRSFNKVMKDDEGGTMILEEGLKYQPISVPPEDAQFLETRKFSVNEIARWFGIPPHLLADLEKTSYNSIEMQNIEFVQYSLLAWIRRWEDELNKKLLTEEEKEDHFFKFNLNGLLRGDSKTRFEAYGLALDRGWMNIDEVRALEEMNNLPDGLGKKYLIQVNRTPIENLGNEKTNSGV